MKILFISNARGPDYMADTIFHGGKSLFGVNFFETTKHWYMYESVPNKESLYGRGFTLYGKIPEKVYSGLPASVEELIGSKFFDKIIYGSIWRCSDYFDLVSRVYKKEDILVVDGEDHITVNNFFVEKSKYFKREYESDNSKVYPINFAIPKELVLNKVTEKSKLISDIIPNFNKNYSFYEESLYYAEYAKSWYAHTQKKGGWDCLRHYEIMMNGCVPIFKNLEECPKNTLTKLPKKEIIDFSKTIVNNIERNQFVLDFVKNNLTTEHIVMDLIK